MKPKPDTITMAELRKDPLYRQARRVCLGLSGLTELSQPRASLLNPAFKYTPANRTDVQSTWRRFGWRPTSEGNAK